MNERPGVDGIVAAAALLATLAGSLLWLTIAATPYRLVSGLTDARSHLAAAEKELGRGTLSAAGTRAAFARAAARRARSALGGPATLLDLARASARAERALGEVPLLVTAAERSAAAAAIVLDVAQNALRGPDAIIAEDPADPKGGARVRIDRVREVAAEIRRARSELAAARSALANVDVADLPRRFRGAVDEGMDRASTTDRALADAEAGFAILPSILGDDGPRNYLIGMQNSAELRGTGGSILRFSLLSIDDGRPELETPKSVYRVDVDRTQIDIDLPRDAWYVRGISDAHRFGNANWSPHWPLSARVALAYGEASGARLPAVHGVIAADPMAVHDMLAGVGPVTAGTRPITRANLLRFVFYKAYAQFPNPGHRRALLNSLTESFYAQLLRAGHPAELMRGIARALATKHIQIWLADAGEQAFVARMNWDAGIERAPRSDYVFVVEQNVGGNKLNFVEEQRYEMDVELTATDARVSTEVRVANPVVLPQPRWWEGDSDGFHRPMLNLYVRRDARLLRAEVVDGERLDAAAEGVAAWTGDRPAEHVEVGKKVWSVVLDIPPRREGAVRYDYVVPGVVHAVGERRVYRLVVQHQPKVNPETLALRLRLPHGAADVRADGFERRDGVLVLERTVDADLVLEVSWRQT